MTEIKRVILYKHGMAYFECRAEVQDRTRIELEFTQEEMNDILKSLTVLDLNGGVISNIAYDAQRPVSEELADIALDIPDQDVLSGMLQALRGCHVQLQIAGREATVSGQVVGLENRSSIVQDQKVQSKRLLLRKAEGNFCNFDIFEIQDIQILDSKVQSDMERLLSAWQYWKKKDLKKLEIFAEGQGARQLQISYAVPAPVWKISYRVLLRPDQEALLQGWAHIDNTSQSDWQSVSLSLVAGLPISFIHNLYSPRRRARPEIAISEEAAYGAPVVEDGIRSKVDLPEMEPMEDIPDPVPAAMPSVYKKAKREMAPKSRARAMSDHRNEELSLHVDDVFEQAVEVAHHKIEMADLYVYNIELPITVKRGKSALVPILSSSLKARQVALYNQQIRAENPMTALEFQNDTELVLEGGPMTLYQSQEYVGEAMMNTLKSGQKTILPFAVELACRIDRDHKSETRGVVRCEIRHGILFLTSRLEKKTIYKINNQNNKKELRLYLDHPFEKGWELADSMPQMIESTPNYYRFHLDIKAQQPHTFEVLEYGKSIQQIQVQNLADASLEYYISMNYFDSTISQSLSRLGDIKGQLAQLENQSDQVQIKIDGIFENQTRIRENLKALGDRPEEAELRSRYLKQWQEDEQRLKEAESEQSVLGTKQEELESEREVLIKDLSYKTEFAKPK